MNKMLFPSIFAVLFIARFEGFAQERSEAPAFADGDFWQYRVVEHGDYMKTERELNGIYELVYSNGQLKTYNLETTQKKQLNFEAGVLLGLVGQTDLQYIQFPLYKGRSWTTDYTFRPRRREVDRAVKAITKVTDFGEVKISLSTFKAFKLKREARFKTVDHWVYVYYWSPQTKSIVKYEMEVLKGAAAGNKREIELIKFGSAR